MENKHISEDIQGVNCQVCGSETFRIITREINIVPGVSVKIGCCPPCIKKIDAGKEKDLEEEAVIETDKAKRKQIFKERARQWANNLHGKKVIIFWDRDTAQIFCRPTSEYHARGVAYVMKDTCGGWAQVKVILDKEENKRVKKACHAVMYCSTAGRDMYFVPDSFSCDQAKCKEQKPVMDGKRFSRFVFPTGDGNWYIPVTWGERKSIVLDEDEKGDSTPL